MARKWRGKKKRVEGRLDALTLLPFVRCGERGPMAFVSPSTHCVDLLFSMGTGLERQQGALQLERVNVLAPVERGLCANKDQVLKAGLIGTLVELLPEMSQTQL